MLSFLNIIYVLTIFLFILNCAGTKSRSDITIEERYNQAMKYFENKKYVRAQDEFNSVLILGSGSEYGDDAQYFLGESYFLNKEYILAIAEYEKLTRKMGFSPFVEKARFKICEAYRIESPKYYHDQNYTEKALSRYQEFLDDFPNSSHKKEVLKSIDVLRNKIGQKEFESGILYMKMEEFESAIMIFDRVDENYYDTEIIHKARLYMIKACAKNENLSLAKQYLIRFESDLKENNLYNEAVIAINQAEKINLKSSK
tara:strand:- start:11629 stop:12399 length:771 start_codon:yes stop_codon:yes gene_type:complete